MPPPPEEAVSALKNHAKYDFATITVMHNRERLYNNRLPT